MRTIFTHIAITLIAIAAPVAMLSTASGATLYDSRPISLGVLAAGIVIGNVLLWRYAISVSYSSAALFVLKSLLFDSGWVLALAMLMPVKIPSVPAAGPEMAASTASAPSPALPAMWVRFLTGLGFCIAVAGLVVGDESVIRPVLVVLPFLKSPSRKQREASDSAFLKVRKNVEDGKIDDMLTFLRDLEPDQLSKRYQPEGEFLKAYASLRVDGAEASIPLLDKLHRAHPRSREYAYLLAYAYLSAKQAAKAGGLWKHLYETAPDFLETKNNYSYAALAEAEECKRNGKFSEALALFDTVRTLGIHADQVPQSMNNEQLMAAAAKLGDGHPEEAVSLFDRIASEGTAGHDGLVEALGRAGHAIVLLRQRDGEAAAREFRELLPTFRVFAGIQDGASASEAELYLPLGDRQLGAHSNGGTRAAVPVNALHRSVARDLHFLHAISEVIAWSKLPSSDRPVEDRKRCTLTLQELQNSLAMDPFFMDALAIYGLLLHFYGRRPAAALAYLDQAHRAGFEEPALLALIERNRAVSNVRAQTKADLLQRLHEYFTNDEVPRRLKEELLKEESIRAGYEGYAGAVPIEGILEQEPSVAHLAARGSRLIEEMEELVKAWEATGDQEKASRIKQKLTKLQEGNKGLLEARKARELLEFEVLRESSTVYLSDTF